MTTREIFEANQVLTVEVANTLIGKRLAITNPEYKHNTPDVRIFTLIGLISEWDMETPERIKLQYEGDNPWATCESGNGCLPEGTFFGSDADREIYFVILD